MAVAIAARASAQVGPTRHPGEVGIAALTRQTRIANGASVGTGPRQWPQELHTSCCFTSTPDSIPVVRAPVRQAPALLHTVSTAVAGGMGGCGVHDNITQPHTGHLGVVHCLQQYSLQARQHLQHLGPLHGPARLMHPVFLEGTSVVQPISAYTAFMTPP